jgi:Ca2+-binding RTX toxin-like protein
MFWFNRKSSPAKQRRHTTLAVEKFEDRCLMAGMVPSGDLSNVPHEERELEAWGIVRELRQEMIGCTSAVELQRFQNPQKYKDLWTKPLYEVSKGNLVILGTSGEDTVSVEEQPMVKDRNGVVKRAAQYFINVTSRNNGRVTGMLKEHVPIGDLSTLDGMRRVYFLGREQADVFTFKPLVGSVTRVLADGGPGADTLTGGRQADFLDGGLESNDIDKLIGGDGHDVLAGGGGDDTLHGNGDNDLLWGDAGSDTLEGAAGHDSLFGCEDADGKFVAKRKGNKVVQERVGGLDGGEGNDHLSGGDGADWLIGGFNDDYLDGGPDVDHMDGGFGRDTLKTDHAIEGQYADDEDIVLGPGAGQRKRK